MPSQQLDSQSAGLLAAVRRRIGLVRFGHWFHRSLLATAGVYLLLWVVIRFTGLIPDVLAPWTLLAVPGVAALAALFLLRRPTDADAARAVDVHIGGKDLFLTASLIDGTPGEYQSLVLRDAAKKSPGVQPGRVVPMPMWPASGNVAAAMVVLLILVMIPLQLDPFGEREQLARLNERKELVKKERQVTIERAAQLARQDLTAELSKPVDARLNELRKQFNEMKPDDPTGNARKLAEQQRELDKQWRKLSEKKLRDAMANKSTSQRFGGGMNKNIRQWQEEMKRGDPTGLKNKIAELQKKAEQLADSKDPAEQQKLKQELKQGMQDLADFAAQDPNAAAMAAAANRAMQQLDMSSLEGMSQESLAAMQESLNLSQMEMESLAQTMRDMQAMQQAMKAAQMAQQANQQQPLDGSQCQGTGQGMGQCDAMAAYSQFYKQCMGQGQGQGMAQGQGSGQGGGMGGPGQGRGNIAPEDDSVASAFKTEKEKTAMKAGKIIMQWKTKEVSQTGEANKDYATAMNDVKQGVAEAMLQEQIPPGYHDGIKKYFDTIDAPATTEPGAPAEPEAP